MYGCAKATNMGGWVRLSPRGQRDPVNRRGTRPSSLSRQRTSANGPGTGLLPPSIGADSAFGRAQRRRGRPHREFTLNVKTIAYPALKS